MAAQPVEGVLVVYYGPEAHRATYGRQVSGTRYTKDYIQLSRKPAFIEAASRLFPMTGGVGSVPLTYQWPTGTTAGSFVFHSSDRPHLKWETSVGAPQAWKMANFPNETTAQTIPGNPGFIDFDSAENEFELLASRGAGQPYLIAVKLRDEQNRLHLRAYLGNPSESFAWADLAQVPEHIRTLAGRTSQQLALAWDTFDSGGVVPSENLVATLSQLAEADDFTLFLNGLDRNLGLPLVSYLRQPGTGLFFDPSRNHDAWIQTFPLPQNVVASIDEILTNLEARFSPTRLNDAAAEALESDPTQVIAFRDQIRRKEFEVPDLTATVKTRGSAQKVFADAVKSNYGMRCAITGIATREFLVASHIVPWSEDQTIRLDPANGICLSLLVDRAFEMGYLLIEDDCTIRLVRERLADDELLWSQLEPYDGTRLNTPSEEGPNIEYLQRRRAQNPPIE